ncbi:MAG: CocE/NonD family hydrolase [Acidimicrobiales bacterium]
MTSTTQLREVVTLSDVAIPLSDGTKLAARIWLPEDAESSPVSAILDFLPYRQGDLMVVRDSTIFPYWAARGYGCARVDLRGTGNSTGIITDEYTAQEQADGEEVIAWLAAQPWCDGGVGMTGISWGGFNSLQLAARRPPALRAIITLCASDDRYSDDVHYRGGCVLAVDMLQWAVAMLTWNALPPDPAVAGASWREEWRRRVEETPAFIEPWMAHQRRDDYWRQGSVCEDYSAIEVPVYAVGGWSDGYVDAVPRLLANLSCPRKGLIGPWSHAIPNHSVPGPEIGFLEEALRWWDHWLKGIDTGITSEPMLRAWMQEYTQPAPFHAHWPGRWVAEAQWPPPGGLGERMRRMYLAARGGDSAGSLEAQPGDGRSLFHTGDQTAGLDAGSLTADGGHGDWPGDQRGEDGMSLSFTSAVLDSRVEMLGNAAVELEISSTRPVATVIVRLLDVAPTGESLLVTRGMLNLTHRFGHDRVEQLEPGRRSTVSVPLKAIGHCFPAGHHIRVTVASTYWPWIWPAPEAVTLELSCGASSFIDLPVRDRQSGDLELREFGPPERVAPVAHERLGGQPTSRKIVHDLATSSSEVVFDWNVGGNVRLADSAIEYDGATLTTYRIDSSDPLSAEVTTEQSASLRREGEFDVRVEATGRMTADAGSFLVTMSLDALEDGHRVMNRLWSLRFPRDGV